MPDRIDRCLGDWHRMVAEKDLDALAALRDEIGPQMAAFLARSGAGGGSGGR